MNKGLLMFMSSLGLLVIFAIIKMGIVPDFLMGFEIYLALIGIVFSYPLYKLEKWLGN